jgi:hypothetical protein
MSLGQLTRRGAGEIERRCFGTSDPAQAECLTTGSGVVKRSWEMDSGLTETRQGPVTTFLFRYTLGRDTASGRGASGSSGAALKGDDGRRE